MKITHKQKVKIARGIGGFNSEAWAKRKEAVALRVKRKEAKVKKGIRILDDKGKEHKMGEIFQSNEITIET